VAALEDAHGGEEADAGAEAGAADLKLAGEITFGRESIAGLDLAIADEGSDVFDDLHGELAVASCLVVNLFCLFGFFLHARSGSLSGMEKSITEVSAVKGAGEGFAVNIGA
jgi:ABC-type sugar transport system permease subunit